MQTEPGDAMRALETHVERKVSRCAAAHPEVEIYACAAYRDHIREHGISASTMETPEEFARARLGDLWDDQPSMVLNDEWKS